MARIRTIKPSFFSSMTVAALPVEARLTFIGLWTYVDDAGRGMDDARLIRAALWPLDDRRTAKAIGVDLRLLAEHDLIERYRYDGREYLRVRNWREHQRINRPQPSRIPPSPEEEALRIAHGTSMEHSVNAHGADSDAAVNGACAGTEPSPPEGKGRERKGKEPPLPPPSDAPSPDITASEEEMLRRAQAMAESDLANALGRGVGVRSRDGWLRAATAKRLDELRRAAPPDDAAQRASAEALGRNWVGVVDDQATAKEAFVANTGSAELADVALSAWSAARAGRR